LETTVKRLYEAMFLVDSAKATDWDGTIAAIKTILERIEAEIVVLRKWDERRLAYEIKGKSRGTYILCYFRAGGNRIQDIEKAVQLSERIMRVLVLSAEARDEADIEKDLAEPGSTTAVEEKAASERTEGPEHEAAEESEEQTQEAADVPDEAEKKLVSAETEAEQTEEPQELTESAEEKTEQSNDTENLELSDEQVRKEAAED
jgi:small subunit ribosomal protein S6